MFANILLKIQTYNISAPKFQFYWTREPTKHFLHKFILVTVFYRTHSSHLLNLLNKAIDDREEGVVIKRIDSQYAPGKRTAGWYKIKPDVS